MSIKIASMNFGDCDTILHNTPNGMKNIAEVLGPNGEVYWTSTKELTGVPPLSIRSNGTMLLDYLISGNMSQSGTPTPTTPIMPQGTGERTGNLFDKTTLENGIYLAANGNKYGDVTNGVRAGVKIKVLPNTAYTLSAQSSVNVSLRIFEWSNGTFTTQTPKYNISGNISLTVTTDAETTEIAFNIEGANGQYVTNIMLNTGSTALPYENYGYKIPISSGGENLFDKDNADITHIYPLLNGTTFTQGGENTWSIIMPCKPNTTYVISKDILPGASGDRRHRVSGSDEYPTVGGAQTFVDDSSETISGDPRARQIFTTTADTHWIVCFLYYAASYETIIEQIQSIQIEEDNDKTEYEPYVQPTLSNIYLGNVPTTRYVKKLVLDGTESWEINTTNNMFFYVNHLVDNVRQINGFCTHFSYFVVTSSNTSNGVCVTINGAVRLRYSEYNTVDDFKSFLAAQFAAGTPVMSYLS